MSATATQAPVIPPRPGRSQEKATMPVIPPRPTKSRIERSLSPNPARFAPSPLNDPRFTTKPPNGSSLSVGDEPVPRSTSVDLPSVGEEGQEYARIAEQLSTSAGQASSPEHTSTVATDLQLYAPKPSLPAVSAKQRVLAVTRTDSDKAASFGIGRPSSITEDPAHFAPGSTRSLKKKASTTSQLSNTSASHTEDEHGIPEIGVQVPMYPNAGDVQAPSPAPGAIDIPKAKHHNRKTSGRGIPPGSYGLHGHGVGPQDKLDKAYYEKHPEVLKKEHLLPHHSDRPHDFSMSSDDLNRIVRETASRGAGGVKSTPSDEIGWQAMEESTSRTASPRPKSVEIKAADVKSPLKQVFSAEETRGPAEGEVIHVEEPGHRKSVVFSDAGVSSVDDEGYHYTAPILAEDEVAKAPHSAGEHPAVEPGPERRGSAFEMDEPTSRPSSQPQSRPSSVYKDSSFELRSTPLEDVEEYEPLFPEDEKSATTTQQKPSPPESIKGERKRGFPSQDIWEDAPSSVHYTAEVSTPDFPDAFAGGVITPPRDSETPAQAFARQQEEIAERETKLWGPDRYNVDRRAPSASTNGQKMLWAEHQVHIKGEMANKSSSTTSRPNMAQRFPSRDVWEDTPDSHKLETTVSGPQKDHDAAESPVDSNPEIPSRPVQKSAPAAGESPSEQKDKPAIPDRPKAKSASADDATPSTKPVIPERPRKPIIPARPAKAGPTSGGLEPAEAAAPPPKTKPAVPMRPAGSKIAALQAGFMSDLNNRLRLGPQAPKKVEEPKEEEGLAEEKEKVPLTDARKGRARGPQRRAPAAKSPSPAAAPAVAPEKSAVSFSFSVVQTVWEIDPEEGDVNAGKADTKAEAVAEAKEEVPAQMKEEAKDEVKVKVEDDAEPLPEVQIKTEEPEEKEGVKTLATNMAGEPVVEEHEKKDEVTEEVETEVVEN